MHKQSSLIFEKNIAYILVAGFLNFTKNVFWG